MKGRKQSIERSTAVYGKGIPIGGVTDPANRNDSPLLAPTLEHASASVGGLPEEASVHPVRAYDSNVTRERLKERGMNAEIAKKGEPAPLQAGKRWVVERRFSWIDQNRRMSEDCSGCRRPEKPSFTWR